MKYVLVTAARNEEKFIGLTLKSVVAQTARPLKWVIVSDGSTDRTEEIVREFAALHDFIELVCVGGDAKRGFPGKARAIKTARENLGSLDYDFIGNLDADISFGPGYYEAVLSRMDKTPRLGIAGGVQFDVYPSGLRRKTNTPQMSVCGPIQTFRRECFDQVGGYRPFKHGGEDAIAEFLARSHGWRIRTLPEARALHHRPTGTAVDGLIRARFCQGLQDYDLGNHPLFEIVKCAYRMRDVPWVLGGVVRFAGFVSATLRREQRGLPPDLTKALQREQLSRLIPGARAPFASANSPRDETPSPKSHAQTSD